MARVMHQHNPTQTALIPEFRSRHSWHIFSDQPCSLFCRYRSVSRLTSDIANMVIVAQSGNDLKRQYDAQSSFGGTRHNIRCIVKGSRRECSSDAKTEVEISDVWGHARAGGRPDTGRIIVPTAAANNTFATYAADPHRAIGRSSRIRFLVTVLRPLPDISVHLIDARWIWSKRIDWGGPLPPYALGPISVGY